MVFSLGRWASLIHTGFHVSRATWVHIYSCLILFAYRTVTFCGGTFQSASAKDKTSAAGNLPIPDNVTRYPTYATPADFDTYMVWAPPRSLAATWGITVVFFSSGY